MKSEKGSRGGDGGGRYSGGADGGQSGGGGGKDVRSPWIQGSLAPLDCTLDTVSSFIVLYFFLSNLTWISVELAALCIIYNNGFNFNHPLKKK